MRKAVPSVITKVKARQILDSRGIPTVEVDLYTNKGMFRASAPSGDPTGMYAFLLLFYLFIYFLFFVSVLVLMISFLKMFCLVAESFRIILLLHELCYHYLLFIF